GGVLNPSGFFLVKILPRIVQNVQNCSFFNQKCVNLLLRFCYGMTKACHRSRKYSLLGGGIDTNSCQNRPVFFPLLHNGHDSTTSNYPGVVKDLA
ncbi:hypothetical protein, partial [Shigella sonnei]|uniref:hypothetical protein n=1 Tax=Shigella sonnei TaxID=624 RepID=UPI001C0A6F9F